MLYAIEPLMTSAVLIIITRMIIIIIIKALILRHISTGLIGALQ